MLKIADEGTHCSVVRFLLNLNTNTIRKIILPSWTFTYTGMFHKILIYQRSAFGKPFANLFQVGGVEVQRMGIESHARFNLGERYHEQLRKTFRKLMTAYPNS